MVIIEGFVDGDLDGEVGGDAESVGVGVVGFGFVCSYYLLGVWIAIEKGRQTND